MATWAEDLRGKRVAVFGGMIDWPSWLGADPIAALTRRGALIADKVTPDLDWVVLGPKRGKGKTEAERAVAAQSGKARYQLLDQPGLEHLLRMDLAGSRFFFAGGFDRADPGVPASHPSAIATAAGCVVADTLDETVEFAVIGPRRAAGRLAAERTAKELKASGSLTVLDEEAFFQLMRGQGGGGDTGLAGMLVELNALLDPKRVRRALDMLQKERFQLYVDQDEERLVGVVRSQTSVGLYAPHLRADGRFGCATPELDECMGVQGKVCKHLILLVLGVASSGGDGAGLLRWVSKAAGARPKTDMDLAAQAFLRHQGAEAGEVDWRPTETLPEDFYAF
ncbi:MAG: hypothetical protein H6735_07255 [Alphaproteobacteria bacterium]|nr:hypothetical protein [Alphaproteobacteria bacterium]